MLTHRYLRYISWNGGHSPPQAGFSTPCRNPRTHRFAAVPIPKAAIARPYLYFHLEDKANTLPIFPPKKTLFFPFSRTFACRSFRVALPAALRACCPRPICGRSIACRPRRLLRPSHKQKKRGPTALRREPAHHKKCRLLAQENTRRHAWLTRSCFGRKNLFIDGPHSLLPFFLSPFLQRKRKKKTEANSAGSNTSLGLTSFVLTMYAIGPSRLVR